MYRRKNGDPIQKYKHGNQINNVAMKQVENCLISVAPPELFWKKNLDNK